MFFKKISFDQLDHRQRQVIQFFEGEQSIFLTGKAGTGKSLILKTWREQTKKNMVILAPTGVAAINVEGQTIHSFFNFQPGILPQEAKDKAKTISQEKLKLIRKLDTIVIDEISMVRSDLLDAIDTYLTGIFSNHDQTKEEEQLIKTPPFGGIQMIFIGDLYQLAPVVNKEDKLLFKKDYPGPYFFDSLVFRQKKFLPILLELKTIYRQQEDESFQKILNHIRHRTISQPLLDQLNQRVNHPIDGNNSNQAIYLTGINKKAYEINQKRLNLIKQPLKTFKAEISGHHDDHPFPTEEILSLKKKARVMFVKNDPINGWVNGTMGTVMEFVTDQDEEGKKIQGVVVQKDDEQSMVYVFPSTWEIFKYQLEKNQITRTSVGSFVQLPLKLAWAITIHKSQGKTFPKMIIDLSTRMFAHGQAYVAFSRGVELNNITLTHCLRKSDIQLDHRVVQFLNQYQSLQAKKKPTIDHLIEKLNDQIKNQQRTKMLYLNNKKEITEREIIPHEIKEMVFQGKKFIGMNAYCLTKKGNRIFSIKNILRIIN